MDIRGRKWFLILTTNAYYELATLLFYHISINFQKVD